MQHLSTAFRVSVFLSCIRRHICNTVSCVNLPAGPTIARRRSKDSQRVNSSLSYRDDLRICNSSSVLEKSKLCENVLPRRPHWLRSRSGEMLLVESLDGGPNFFGQFLEEALVEDCQVPHERNFMHHVGSCLALLSLQSIGNTKRIHTGPHATVPGTRGRRTTCFGCQSHTRVRLQHFRQVG